MNCLPEKAAISISLTKKKRPRNYKTQRYLPGTLVQDVNRQRSWAYKMASRCVRSRLVTDLEIRATIPSLYTNPTKLGLALALSSCRKNRAVQAWTRPSLAQLAMNLADRVVTASHSGLHKPKRAKRRPNLQGEPRKASLEDRASLWLLPPRFSPYSRPPFLALLPPFRSLLSAHRAEKLKLGSWYFTQTAQTTKEENDPRQSRR